MAQQMIDSPSSEGDAERSVMEALEDYWFPVAWSSEVTDAPVPVRLLDKRLVLWRSNGTVVAFYDLCIHRGAPLSLGYVNGDGQLVCGYHGWHYDCAGTCVRIPSLPADRTIPSKAKAMPYHVEERYGLVWVCLAEEPTREIPAFPEELDDPTWNRETTEGVWNCNAARFIENMMDTSHFAWVHEGIFGTKEQPIITPPDIDVTGDGMTYTCVEPIGNMVEPHKTHIRDYRLTFPFQIEFRVHQPGRTEHDVVWFACSPVSARETKFFLFKLTDYEHPLPRELRLAETKIITSQDRTIIESQRPEELPLSLREELHLRGPDDVSLTYRRQLAELGITWE